MPGKWNRCCLTLLLITQIAALLFSPLPTSAQQTPQTVTGRGTVLDYPGLTITFPPAGGAVNGKAVFEGKTGDCTGTSTITMTGTFAGGDGGAASGTMDLILEGYSCLTMENKIEGTWDGVFSDSGQASGIISIPYIAIGPGLYDVEYPWKIAYSPEEFAAALPAKVTAESIYQNYGIIVEDSFGEDGWEATSWSDQELKLLDEVLRELPPAVREKMKVTRIIRNKVDLDKEGNPKPTIFGKYQPCGDQKAGRDCDGSAASIRIFDQASQPFDFTNDPNGRKEFKGVILHELTHALTYFKDKNSIYKNPNASPLLQNYMDATRQDTRLEASLRQNGWGFYVSEQRWKLVGAVDNKPPTDYGSSTPGEDLCESVMMYMYEPQKLKGSSIKRYNFIRDLVFEGVEYETGHE